MIYFNHNATSYPKPEEVLNAVNDAMTGLPSNPYRSGFDTKSEITECRQKLADFFNAHDPYQVIFTSGSTEALNLAIFGLENLNHVVSTAIEHNSVIRPLKTLERDTGTELSFATCDNMGFVRLNELESMIRKDTDAIIVNHCSNVLGTIQNLDSISKIASKHRVKLIVDASQSAGAVEIDLEKTPVDALAFTGHKNLMGIQGTGGLIINKKLNIKPLKVGGTGTKSDLLYQPQELPLYYEAGTPNSVGIAALSAGLDYVSKTSLSTINEHKKRIYETIIGKLQDEKRIVFFAGTSLEQRLPVINFGIEGISPQDISYILAESYGINVRSGLHCAPFIHQHIGSLPEGTVRVSFSHFNTINEAEQLSEAILDIAQTA